MMDRRTFLATTGLAGASATAGCLSTLFGTGSGEPPLVEDRPDAVYVPTHVEGMQMAGMGTAGAYRLALFYNFPHRFWLVTGQNRERVDVQEDDDVHLMASIWDEETGTVVPASNLSVEVTTGGQSVDSRRMWPMLSQNMGFHYGDNVGLDGDGTYEATVTIDPPGVRRTGAFRDRFGEVASATVEFEFSQGTLEEIPFEPLDARAGSRGAAGPMEMEMLPLARTPDRSALPGSFVGEADSGDGTFLVTVLENAPAGIEAEGPYLVVSARTPHHQFPLPMMSLSATLVRGGETAFEGPLRATLDPDLAYHYGAVLDSLDVEAGDELQLSVGVPPQVARHEGYETAFFEMSAMTLTV